MQNQLELKLNVPTDSDTNQYLLSLGSNINPTENIIKAVKLLAPEVSVLHVSSVWKSEAVGSDGPDFLNAALLIQSKLAPAELKMNVLSKIENQLGRSRTEDKNSPRTIDIDILAENEKILDLEIWTQAHLAVPASEIIPHLSQLETGMILSDQAKKLAARTKIFPAANMDLSRFLD